MPKLLAAPILLCLALISCAPPAALPSTPPAACDGVQTKENPLHDPTRIVDIQVISKRDLRGNPLTEKKQGIALVLRAERGLTPEWLLHVLECDVGHAHQTSSACPLALPTAEVTVDSVGGRLVVYVRYSDRASLARAVELASQFRASQG